MGFHLTAPWGKPRCAAGSGELLSSRAAPSHPLLSVRGDFEVVISIVPQSRGVFLGSISSNCAKRPDLLRSRRGGRRPQIPQKKDTTEVVSFFVVEISGIEPLTS